jgi:hypothetical protein
VRGLVVEGFERFFLKSGDCGLDLAWPKGEGELGPMATYMPFPEPKTRAKFTLQRDENYTKLVRYMRERASLPPECFCIGCFRYEVTATFVGLTEVARPDQPGFGHMNWGRVRLVIRSVSEVIPVDLGERARPPGCPPILTLPPNLYPGWDLPPSVPPYPSPGPNPK